MSPIRTAWRKTIRPLIVVLTVCTIQLTTLGSTVSARPMTTVAPNCGSGDQSANCNDLLAYSNGPVQHHPVVYLIFWGTNWPSDPNGVVTAEQNYFSSLAGTAYNNILTYYHDNSDFVHNDVRLGGTWIDTVDARPQHYLNASEMDYEVSQAESIQHWSPTADTQFIVFPQQGTVFDPSYDGYCGQHLWASTGTVFSWIRYASDPNVAGSVGCLPMSVADSMTSIAGHEYAEAATDPTGPGFISHLQQWGWATIDPVTDPIEVGDKCQGYGPQYPLDSYVSGDGPYLWDQGARSCALMRGQDYPSPDYSGSFHGVHTVQGSILSKYQAFGANGGGLGDPTTEETVISSGRVSYFYGNLCGGRGPNNSGSAIYYSSGTGAHQVGGCIYNKYWSSMNGPNGLLGFPVSDVATISSGYVSYFAGQVCIAAGPNNSGSAIYYSGGTGGHEVHGCIFNEYWQFAGGPANLGFPTTDEQGIAGGRVNYFAGQVCGGAGPNNSGSAIYYTSGTGANEVQGCIYHEYWATMGGPGGALGFPTWDEQAIAGGRVSYFAGQVCNGQGPFSSGSAIYYSGSTGAHEVQGCIYNKYWYFMNGPSGALGFPTADERGITSGYSLTPARYSSFQHGSIYWYNGHGYEVQGAIYNAYLGHGGASGTMGLPVSDEYSASSTYQESDFENGYILYNKTNGQITVVIYQ